MLGHEFYMKQALAEAVRAFDEEEVPVGAVIVHENMVIAKGHNQIKTLKDPTAHAEMIVLTQAASHLQNERLKGCTLYVTLEPCAMCVGAAILARVEKIIFGAWDPKTGACGSKIELTKKGLLNHDIEVIGGILEAECRTIIQDFFMDKR
ncbi:MAG: tRNA adenosine(34) deaminase TadA [Candidatus Omnitrophica bacterium]|nr:tRNA adenosine(34) deaminase TadA [Candidatus Omnitrophota bacterium]